MIYRVEITRDETRDSGEAAAQITAYIDREPEPSEAGVGRLVRAFASVWKSRLFYGGDFSTLAEALAAIDAAFPAVARIDCFEWPFDCDYPLDMPPLLKAGDKWAPGPPRSPGPPPQLDWRLG